MNSPVASARDTGPGRKNQVVAGHGRIMTGTDSADSARRARFAHVFALVYEPLQRYVRRRGGGPDTDDIVARLWER